MSDSDIDKLENMALLARSGFDWQDRLEMYKRELYRAGPALLAELRRLRELRSEVRRLRRIEANARDFARKAYTSEAVASFDALKAALAAKGTT